MKKLSAPRLFAHRAYHKNKIAENSIKALDAAYQNNFTAIEFDLQFYQNQIFIHHDEISSNQNKNYPTLRDFFKYQNHFFYWLDFKNIDRNNCQKIAEIVKKETEIAKINLAKIYFAPFVTDLENSIEIYHLMQEKFSEKINFISVCEKISDSSQLEQIAAKLNQAKIKNLSINHQILNAENIKILAEIELFAWTVNKIERLKELEKIGVRNFATDIITPEIYQKTSS
jgi:glycerophosphoryl diester phosphodiesterase